MGCARMYIKHPRQLAATAHPAINALLRKRHLTGGGPSLASRSPLRRLPLKPRWRPKKQSKFTVSDQSSLSSRTPGSRSSVAAAWLHPTGDPESLTLENAHSLACIPSTSSNYRWRRVVGQDPITAG